jgi:hypothetical protein
VRCRDRAFSDGRIGLVAFEYAIESNPYYRLLKDHKGQLFRIALADGEEAVVSIVYVDEEHEDFVYDLLSTNLDGKYRDMPKKAVYAAKFADVISAQLEE